MLVWQDAVSGGGTDGEYNAWTTNRKPTLIRSTGTNSATTPPKHFTALGADDPIYRRDWSRTCDAMVHMLGGHPSIVTWTRCSTKAGANSTRVTQPNASTRLTRRARLTLQAGWYDQRCGDFHSVHNYFRPLEIYPDKGPLRGYVAEYEKRHKRRRRAAHYAVLPVAQHGVRAFMISNSADWRSSYRSMRRCRAPTVTVNTIRSTIGGPPCVPCSPPAAALESRDLRDTCIRRFPTWKKSSTAC